MENKRKKSLFVPLLILLILLSIGVGFIVNMINSMKNYVIIEEQVLTTEDEIFLQDLDFGVNFTLDYVEILDTTNLDNYKTNTINYYKMFYRFMNFKEYDIQKYNNDIYMFHLKIEEDYNIYFNSTDSNIGVINYKDFVLNYTYNNRLLTINYNNTLFEFVFNDSIQIKVIQNNIEKYAFNINYNRGNSYCEMEILTMFNNLGKVEKYILNKADDRLFSHFDNELIKYSYIIKTVNNEFIFTENFGGKYD